MLLGYVFFLKELGCIHLIFLCSLYLRQCSVFTHTGRTAALFSEAHVITESLSTEVIHKVPTDFSTAGPNCWRGVHLHHQAVLGSRGGGFHPVYCVFLLIRSDCEFLVLSELQCSVEQLSSCDTLLKLGRSSNTDDFSIVFCTACHVLHVRNFLDWFE